MKTEQEQQQFEQKQKDIAKVHSDLVNQIGTPRTPEEQQKVDDSEKQMISAMEKLVFEYIGPEFQQMMQEKDYILYYGSSE